MTPNKKRNRNTEPSDSSEPFAKGARGGGGPLLVPGSSASTHRKVGERSGAIPRSRASREKNYLHGMAKLNYQVVQWAKRELESGRVPDDAFYHGMAENYYHQKGELRRRHVPGYGDIAVFGQGDCNQLGCGESITESRKPRTLVNLRGFKINMVASGGLHSLALDEDGTVYSWGCNDEGSLGWLTTEAEDDGALPSEVKGFHPSQFGPNGTTEELRDGDGRIVPFDRRKGASITQVATGETQSLALSTAGDVYMWGNYKDNEGRGFRHMPPADDARLATGNKNMANLEEDDNPEWFKPPRGNQDWPLHLVEMKKRVKAVAAGGSFNVALYEDDTVVTWGIGTCGELARPVPALTKSTSNQVVLEQYLKPKPPVWEQPTLKRTVVTMACGGFHLLIVSREQGALSVYSSGLGQYGQLGHGDNENRDVLTKIKHLEGCDIAKVDAGMQFSCFVDKTGKNLYSCGRGDYGQLGITLEQPDAGYLENIPIRVPLVYEPKGSVSNPKENSIKAEDVVNLDQPEIDQVSCGSTHVLVLTKGGDAYSWGFGTSGACGQGSSDADVLRPQKLVTKQCKIQYVSGGGQHSTAIVTTGSAGFAS